MLKICVDQGVPAAAAASSNPVTLLRWLPGPSRVADTKSDGARVTENRIYRPGSVADARSCLACSFLNISESESPLCTLEIIIGL